jgi:hypothetical protein
VIGAWRIVRPRISLRAWLLIVGLFGMNLSTLVRAVCERPQPVGDTISSQGNGFTRYSDGSIVGEQIIRLKGAPPIPPWYEKPPSPDYISRLWGPSRLAAWITLAVVIAWCGLVSWQYVFRGRRKTEKPTWTSSPPSN